MDTHAIECPFCGTGPEPRITNLGVGTTTRTCSSCLREYRVSFKGGGVITVTRHSYLGVTEGTTGRAERAARTAVS